MKHGTTKKINFEHKNITKCRSQNSGSWVFEPMSEILRIIYIKSHITLHVKSNAENVNWMLGASHCYFNVVSWV